MREAINAEWPTVADFEREFPSLCFALATGVGKTRLMGAVISYLHLAHGVKHFFVRAHNLTIYNKLIADFTPNTPKCVFRGEFATEPPQIITGDNYDTTLLDVLAPCRVNIFNISKIYYQWGTGQPRYVPDFGAETASELLMVETKSRRELESAEVAAKKAAAQQWCSNASDHARGYGGKPWRYVLVPHDTVSENMTLEFLARQP